MTDTISSFINEKRVDLKLKFQSIWNDSAQKATQKEFEHKILNEQNSKSQVFIIQPIHIDYINSYFTIVSCKTLQNYILYNETTRLL
jgi:hypothetical protein